MLSIIDDVINDKIDLGEVVEYANEHNDDWEEFRRSEYADARIEDYRLNKD